MVRIAVVSLTIAWVLLGLCLSYLLVRSSFWEQYYFVWDKGKDLLAFLSLYLYGNRFLRQVLTPLLVFLFIRLVWEAFAIPDYKLAMKYEVIDVLFALNLIATVFIAIKCLVYGRR